MFEKKEIRVFRITTKKIIERLMTIVDCDISVLKDEIVEQFDGYDYKDIEEVVGYENWSDISKDGNYELNAKINHEDAYEFTIYIEVKNNKATVYNVL
ncbi:MAG: hypothetical protein U9R37_01785 [Campylobacterota bacterium]|nr:hypothetical protein [Campylobacterota bacterium]